MKNAYFPQLTLEQLNALITAATTRMQEKAGLENAEFRRID